MDPKLEEKINTQPGAIRTTSMRCGGDFQSLWTEWNIILPKYILSFGALMVVGESITTHTH